MGIVWSAGRTHGISFLCERGNRLSDRPRGAYALLYFLPMCVPNRMSKAATRVLFHLLAHPRMRKMSSPAGTTQRTSHHITVVVPAPRLALEPGAVVLIYCQRPLAHG